MKHKPSHSETHPLTLCVCGHRFKDHCGKCEECFAHPDPKRPAAYCKCHMFRAKRKAA